MKLLRHLDHPLQRAMLAGELREDTFSVYRHEVDRFLDYLSGREPSWELLESWLAGRPVKAQSKNVYLSAVKYASRWAAKRFPRETAGYGDFAAAAKLKRVEDVEHHRANTLDELRRVLDACRDGTDRGLHDLALLTLVGRTGARRISAVGLDVEHVDCARRTVRIQNKGGKWFTAPIDEEVADALCAWIARLGATAGPVFRLFLGGDAPSPRRLSRGILGKTLAKRARRRARAHAAPAPRRGDLGLPRPGHARLADRARDRARHRARRRRRPADRPDARHVHRRARHRRADPPHDERTTMSDCPYSSPRWYVP